MIFKARYTVGPANVYVQLFTAKATNMTYASIGTLCMRHGEWNKFRKVLEAGLVEIIVKALEPDRA